MKNVLKTIAAPLLAIFLISSTGASAQSACLSGGQIQQAVAGGQILSLNEIVSIAGHAGSTVLQPVNVCDRGGQLYYELSIVDNAGNAQRLVLHALTGAS